MTIVLDCNVLVMSLGSRSPYHKIYRSLVNGRYNLAVTNDIVLEYQEIIERKYSLTTSRTFLDLLSILPNVISVIPYFNWNLIQVDPDDNKYCDCALNCRADFIVTQDRHFDILQNIPFPLVQVIRIDDFLGRL